MREREREREGEKEREGASSGWREGEVDEPSVREDANRLDHCKTEEARCFPGSSLPFYFACVCVCACVYLCVDDWFIWGGLPINQALNLTLTGLNSPIMTLVNAMKSAH